MWLYRQLLPGGAVLASSPLVSAADNTEVVSCPSCWLQRRGCSAPSVLFILGSRLVGQLQCGPCHAHLKEKTGEAG